MFWLGKVEHKQSLVVRMHSTKQIVYSKICHKYACKRYYHVNVKYTWFCEFGYCLCVQWQRIDEHCYQCPRLFGVPSPISAPTLLCPHCSNKYSGCKQKYGRVEYNAVGVCEPLLHLAAYGNGVYSAKCQITKQCVGHHYKCYMKAQ